MWNVVELSDDRVHDFRSGETICIDDLRAEVTENDDGWLVRAHEDRADKELEIGLPCIVTE